MRLAFDSDGIIKLSKSEVLDSILEQIDGMISKDVEKEAVVEGKKGLYEDAYRIERAIKKDLLGTRKAGKSEKAKNLLRGQENLGKGEKSTLHLFFATKTKAIVSDDKAFLSVLSENDIPFVRPHDLIVKLSVEIGKGKSLKSLERIKEYIRDEDYRKGVNEIKG